MPASTGPPYRPLDDLRAIWSTEHELEEHLRNVLAVFVLVRNNDTGLCNPAVSTLARLLGVSRATVFSRLRKLRARGLATSTVRLNRHRRPVNHYRLHLEKLKDPPDSGPVQFPDPSRSQTRPESGDEAVQVLDRNPSETRTQTALITALTTADSPQTPLKGDLCLGSEASTESDPTPDDTPDDADVWPDPEDVRRWGDKIAFSVFLEDCAKGPLIDRLSFEEWHTKTKPGCPMPKTLRAAAR